MWSEAHCWHSCFMMTEFFPPSSSLSLCYVCEWFLSDPYLSLQHTPSLSMSKTRPRDLSRHMGRFHWAARFYQRMYNVSNSINISFHISSTAYKPDLVKQKCNIKYWGWRFDDLLICEDCGPVHSCMLFILKRFHVNVKSWLNLLCQKRHVMLLWHVL